MTKNLLLCKLRRRANSVVPVLSRTEKAVVPKSKGFSYFFYIYLTALIITYPYLNSGYGGFINEIQQSITNDKLAQEQLRQQQIERQRQSALDARMRAENEARQKNAAYIERFNAGVHARNLEAKNRREAHHVSFHNHASSRGAREQAQTVDFYNQANAMYMARVNAMNMARIHAMNVGRAHDTTMRSCQRVSSFMPDSSSDPSPFADLLDEVDSSATEGDSDPFAELSEDPFAELNDDPFTELQDSAENSPTPGSQPSVVRRNPQGAAEAVPLAYGALCFPGETPICVSTNRSKTIGKIRVGDFVKSCNLDSKHQICEYRRVQHVFESNTDHLLKLHFSGKVLKTTENHPFYVINKKTWVEAKALRKGDQLRTTSGCSTVLRGIEEEFGDFKVYNLDVEKHHNYYAGGVLVHNCTLVDGVAAVGGGAGLVTAIGTTMGAAAGPLALLGAAAAVVRTLDKSDNGIADDSAESNQKAKASEQDSGKSDKQRNGTPGNNQDQNKQFQDATRGLTKDQKRRIHDEISGENMSYKEIRELVKEMFGK
jgi:hypothetical protein